MEPAYEGQGIWTGKAVGAPRFLNKRRPSYLFWQRTLEGAEVERGSPQDLGRGCYAFWQETEQEKVTNDT